MAKNQTYDGPPIEAMTGKSEDEIERQRQEEAEAAHQRAIVMYRAMAHDHLRKAATALRLADRAVKRLGEDDLYDVEFEGSETTYAVARAQIDVAIAALTHLIPS